MEKRGKETIKFGRWIFKEKLGISLQETKVEGSFESDWERRSVGQGVERR